MVFQETDLDRVAANLHKFCSERGSGDCQYSLM